MNSEVPNVAEDVGAVSYAVWMEELLKRARFVREESM